MAALTQLIDNVYTVGIQFSLTKYICLRRFLQFWLIKYLRQVCQTIFYKHTDTKAFEVSRNRACNRSKGRDFVFPFLTCFTR